jgi:drug/metabolite transporter (DMT)-like permease
VDVKGRWVGPVCAVLGVLGFPFKAILIKLAYAWHPVDAVTLLASRMLFSAPFFVAMAWRAGRRPRAVAVTRRDWRALAWLGFIGYYLASLLDFMGLEYVSAAFERLVLFLYPTLVVLLSALLLRKPISRRAGVALALSYAGIALVFANELRFAGDAAGLLTGGALILGEPLHWIQLGGTALVLAGVLLVTLRPKAAAAQSLARTDAA